MIGLRVGPFEIEREAQVPVEGEWYLAERTGTTRRRPTRVLVKLLPPDAPQAERTALQAEFDALRTVEDARVPKAVGYYEGTGAMVLEAVGGAPLSVVVEARKTGSLPMTPATLCDLGLDLSECLQHAHHKGQHHAHLEPDMLWLAADGRLWVWGFGRQANPSDAWMPPERARGLPATAATDQWSLGALLAGLVTGRAPWSAIEEARRGSSDELVDTIEVQWPALGRLLRRMLDPEPSRRFPDLGPVRQELLALGRKAGGLSERRELGVLLAEYAPEPSPEEEAPPPEPLTAYIEGTAEAPSPTLATEDDVTVRQAPSAASPDLAEAEARNESIGRLASPGRLADENIAVVGPELTEDVPAAVVGPDTKETPMPGKDTPTDTHPPEEVEASEEVEAAAAGAPAIPVVADPADADAARMPPPSGIVEWEDEDEDGYEDGDEEATQLVHSEAVMRAIAEARAAQGLEEAKDEDATSTIPPEEEDDVYGGSEDPDIEPTMVFAGALESPNVEAVLDEGSDPGAGTNPTAVPWTDPGGEYGKQEGPATAKLGGDKVVLPEDGELPTPYEPRGMPRNQQIALASVALMVLTGLLYLVLRM